MNPTRAHIHKRLASPGDRPPTRNADPHARLRLLIEMAWLDWKLFGCRTESVEALARQIRKEKKKARQDD